MVGIVLGGLLLGGCGAEAVGSWFPLTAAGPTTGHTRYVTLVDAAPIGSSAVNEPTGLFLIGGTDDCAGDSATAEMYRWQWTSEEANEGIWVEEVPWSAASGSARSRYGVAAAFDEVNQKLVLFGGFGPVSGATCHLDPAPTDTFWIRDIGDWADHSGNTPLPPPRGNAVMYWNAKTEKVMLFGGIGSSGSFLSDTWTLDGETWTEVVDNPDCEDAPPALNFAAAWDPYREELILVGTTDGGSEPVSHTWGYSDACWSAYGEAGNSPPARFGGSMAVDPSRGRLVLTGGMHFVNGSLRERPGTWEWDGWEWHAITASGSPAVWGAALGVERSRGSILLYGGVRASGVTTPVTAEYEGPRVPSRYSPQNCQSAGGEMSLALVLIALLALPRRRRGLLLAALLLLPAASRADEPRKIAYLGMLNTNGVEATDAETISGVLQTFLGQNGKNKVIGPSDIKAMLGLEGQRQLLGCEADSSCLAELGGALGARFAAYADLNKLGSTAVFNLTLLDVENTEVVSRISRTVKLTDTLEPVLDLLEGAVSELFRPLAGEGADGAAPDGGETTTTVAPTPPKEIEAPAISPPAGEKTPLIFASISKGFYLQLRADADLYRDGGLGSGVTLGWGRYLVGAQVSVIAAAPVILRIEARLAPVALGPVHPYLSAGIAFSQPALGPRAALGAELRFGGFLLFFEGAFEEYLLNMKRLQTRAILVAGGIGWRL